jgi:hypothetical protein
MYWPYWLKEEICHSAVQCSAVFDKGQLISKGLVGILNSSKKQTKKFYLQYYDTSG